MGYYACMEITFCLNNSVRAKSVYHNGREYLVAPLSLIVPGVLNGSQGALYYPPEEVGKNPSVWDDTPIVVFHPTDNAGNALSASSPGILDSQGIGFLKDSKYQGKLRSMGWFDVEKTKKVDSRVLDALRNGTPMEISTGVFTDNDDISGNYNGKPYNKVARNYRPDHLAILPGIKGACSLQDGCGLLVNQSNNMGNLSTNEFASDEQRRAFFGIKAKEATSKAKDATNRADEATDKTGNTDFSKKERGDLHTKAAGAHYKAATMHAKAGNKDAAIEHGQKAMDHLNAAAKIQGKGTHNQEVEDMTIMSLLRNDSGFKSDAQRKGFFGIKEKEESAKGASSEARKATDKIEDRGSKSSLSERFDGHKKAEAAHDAASKAHMDLASSHAKAGNQAKAAEHMRKAMKHASKAGEHSNKAEEAHVKAGGMDSVLLNSKEDKVGFLTANCDCWKGEGDDALLNVMSEDKLDLLVNAFKKTSELDKKDPDDDDDDEEDEEYDNNNEDDDDDEDMQDDEGNVKRGKKKGGLRVNSLSLNEWMRLMPEEAKENYEYVQKETNRQRTNLIKRLVANVSSEKQRKQLVTRFSTMRLDELKDLLAITGSDEHSGGNNSTSYIGANGGSVITNSEDDINSDDVLPLPTMNYDNSQEDTRQKATR